MEAADRPVVVSGIRATGRLHLGNYLGAIRNFVPLQESHVCYYFIADYHTLTSLTDPEQLRGNLTEIVLDYLAAGLDPEKCIIFAQSSVPEIAELALLLSMVTTVGELQRCPTFKEKVRTQPDNVNLGLLSYPVLMAADILIQKAALVPVGEDQIPHIEMTQAIARRFNQRYGEVFPIPEALLQKAIRVPGLDGSSKMGKSTGNTIELTDPPDVIRAKIAEAVTDTERRRRLDPGRPWECNLYALHEFVNDEGAVSQINADCRSAAIGCVDCKQMLATATIAFLEPFQTRRIEAACDSDYPERLLHWGGQRARQRAAETVEEVREKMGLRRFIKAF